MFVLADSYRCLWPATAMVPDATQPGHVVEQKFKLLFEIMERDKVLELEEASLKDGSDWRFTMLLQVIKGWEDIVDHDGAPVRFSDETFGHAMQFSWFRFAAFNAYSQAVNGEAARLGN